MTMLRNIGLFLCAAVFSVFSTLTMAEDYVRDGRPCLSGICVGDDITTLSKVKWQPASYRGRPITSLKLKVNDVEQNVIKHFAPSGAAAARAAALYLITDSFDGNAIPKLAKVKGFCERMVISYGFNQNDDGMGMLGVFTSDSGHQTSVLINVVPGSDPSSQSLRVVEIRRSFPREYTTEQISELSRQLEERYGGVQKTQGKPSRTEATWHFNEQFHMLTLWAPSGGEEQIGEQLRRYPGCTKTLKID